MKQLKPGQLFTMYGRVWRVHKCPTNQCLLCKIDDFWFDRNDHRLKGPCVTLCGYKPKIPEDCNVVPVRRKRK